MEGLNNEEKGFTRYTHVLMKAKLKAPLSLVEKDALDTVIMLTIGHNKLAENISAAAIARITSHSKAGVIKAVNSLITKKHSYCG